MFLDEIARRLAAQNVGIYTPPGTVNPNTSIFTSSAATIPAGAGPYLLLVETGGSGSNKTQNDTATENPTAQISARSTSPATARTMLKKAYDALGGANGLYNITLTGTFYLKISARQNITDIGEDDAGRPMLAFNIEAEKAPS